MFVSAEKPRAQCVFRQTLQPVTCRPWTRPGPPCVRPARSPAGAPRLGRRLLQPCLYGGLPAALQSGLHARPGAGDGAGCVSALRTQRPPAVRDARTHTARKYWTTPGWHNSLSNRLGSFLGASSAYFAHTCIFLSFYLIYLSNAEILHVKVAQTL